jgi:hypothetical protein
MDAPGKSKYERGNRRHGDTVKNNNDSENRGHGERSKAKDDRSNHYLGLFFSASPFHLFIGPEFVAVAISI